MRKIKKWLIVLTSILWILSIGAVQAFAYVDAEAQEAAAEAPAAELVPTETEPAEDPAPAEEAPSDDASPEETENGEGAFSVPGNGQIMDDKNNDDTKQFVTVTTKNGNTFFLILDRSSSTDNVYLLSMVDEDDLAEFIDKGETEDVPKVVLPETETTPVEKEPAAETKIEKRASGLTGMNRSALLVGGLAVLIFVVGLYYVKVVKPKKAEDEAEDENLEIDDGGDYFNEDEE